MTRTPLILVALAALSGRALADDAPTPPPLPGGPTSPPPKTPFTAGTTILPKNKPPVHDRHRLRHAILLGGAVGIYVGWETLAKSQLAPGACRLCRVDSTDLKVRDALVWKNTARANTISNITGYGLAPLSAATLLLFASRDAGEERWVDYGDDLLAVTEAAVYTQLVVQVFKYTIGRQRPYAHFEPSGSPITNDDNLSLVSGHSALAFSIATAAGVVAHRRHYKLEPVIWATGMAIAAVTGYLRMAADKHYLTDVLSGAVVGVGGGLAVPWLAGSLPGVPEITPVDGGATVSLAGAF
jgi:membrane-associated phospholipid phosphatase